MKKIIVLALLLLGGLVPQVWAQATGNTSIYVEFPQIAILYYRSSITLQLAANDLITAFAGANPVDTGTTTIPTSFDSISGSLVGDAGTPDTPFNTNVLTTINYFYRVRANYQFQVSVSIIDDTLEADPAEGSGSIGMSNAETRLGPSGTWGTTATQPSPGGLGTVHRGDVRFNLDFSGASLLAGNTSATFGAGVVQTTLAFL